MIKKYLDKRIIAVFLLGIASGMPLALTGSTLALWLAESGIERAAIGALALIGLPYTLKFLWAPLTDIPLIPILCRKFGRRRGWLYFTQALLCLTLVILSQLHPEQNLWMIGFFAVCVAVLSATQDIIIDAYRVEILDEEQYGTGSATAVLGYNIGMRIFAGAMALVIAEFAGWNISYLAMAALVLIGSSATLLIGEPKIEIDNRPETPKAWLAKVAIEPFKDILSRNGAILTLLFVFFYKFPDAFIGLMSYVLYAEVGINKLEIAAIVKTYGLIALIVGGFIGAFLINVTGMFRALMICGVLQIVSNLAFILIVQNGNDPDTLKFVITVENVAAGMGTSAFVAFISKMCKLEYTATQYALLSALASCGRIFLAAPSGALVDGVGWESFFIISALAGIPGLLILWLLKRSKSQL